MFHSLQLALVASGTSTVVESKLAPWIAAQEIFSSCVFSWLFIARIKLWRAFQFDDYVLCFPNKSSGQYLFWNQEWREELPLLCSIGSLRHLPDSRSHWCLPVCHQMQASNPSNPTATSSCHFCNVMIVSNRESFAAYLIWVEHNIKSQLLSK